MQAGIISCQIKRVLLINVYLYPGLGDDVLAESALHVVLVIVPAASLLHPAGGRRELGGVQLLPQGRHGGHLVLLRHLDLLGLAHGLGGATL